MAQGEVVYRIYVVVHFILMLVWIFTALGLDYRFLTRFRKGSPEERTRLFEGIQSVSNVTEMPASFFLPLFGVLLIIAEPAWLRMGYMYGKIALAIAAIGVYHVSRGTLRKMETLTKKGEAVGKLARRYTMLRTVMILLLVTVVGILLWNRRGFTTVFILQSLTGN